MRDTATRMGRLPARTAAAVGVGEHGGAGRVRHAACGQRDRTTGEAGVAAPERDVDREVVAPAAVLEALAELARPVERVDDPDAIREQATGVVDGLLGQHGVAGSGVGQRGREPGLRPGVARPAQVAGAVRRGAVRRGAIGDIGRIGVATELEEHLARALRQRGGEPDVIERGQVARRVGDHRSSRGLAAWIWWRSVAAVGRPSLTRRTRSSRWGEGIIAAWFASRPRVSRPGRRRDPRHPARDRRAPRRHDRRAHGDGRRGADDADADLLLRRRPA